MKVVSYTGDDNLAIVYIAEIGNNRVIEFVESIQPPIPRAKKWVLIVSTLFGCPVGCSICDAGNFYLGKLSKDEIFAQIDFPIKKRFSGNNIPVAKFKIQFARMGEPAINPNVLDVLEELPSRYDAPGLMPCISTIAPSGSERFFERLLDVKNKLYSGRFQLQFSIHTTDDNLRNRLIPVKKWQFSEIARFGEKFYQDGDRKIALNFALEEKSPLDPIILKKYFDPDIFLVKITPMNPTYRAARNGLFSYIDPYRDSAKYEIVESLRMAGYDVIVSVGEVAENNIGSNCGQYVTKYMNEQDDIENSYTYPAQKY